jgi:hypothetical protein
MWKLSRLISVNCENQVTTTVFLLYYFYFLRLWLFGVSPTHVFSEGKVKATLACRIEKNESLFTHVGSQRRYDIHFQSRSSFCDYYVAASNLDKKVSPSRLARHSNLHNHSATQLAKQRAQLSLF